MKRIFTYTIVIFASMMASCVDEEEFDNTPKGNFEALWKILDEHYCFFEYKQHEYGLNWDSVYYKYKVQIEDELTSEQLFEILANMIGELRDGHVNLSTSMDFARYWNWYEDYPSNANDSLFRRYLGNDYKIAGGLKYKILDDNIGYIRYESFSDDFGDSNLDAVINHLMLCRGLIIDIRNNTGGTLTNAESFAARFVNSRTLVGYMQHKTGKGHSDFSTMEEQWLETSSKMRWQKNTCVLTNRMVFSAANEFVKYMYALPCVKIVGDKTGGGAGLPLSSQLPNGWAVRFSACPMYDYNRQSTEFGIEPDYNISLSEEDFLKGEDTIIEFARQLLTQ